MRFFTTLIILGAFGYGAYWVNHNQPELKYKALEIINKNSVCVLEPRFTGNQILERENFSENQYIEPQLLLHPYLLLEVKYTAKDSSTEEGTILWDMIDGEMVINTQNWSKTHGFGDCINAHADWHEYALLKIISQNKGHADRQTFINSLNLESNLLNTWLDRAQKKKLIIEKNNVFRIHIHKPILDVKPSTRIFDPLVTTHQKQSGLITHRFSSKQIIKAAESAFGEDFAIRSTKEIFLPIYCIKIQNSDGSHHTKHWNALNGKPIHLSSLIE